MPVRRGKDGRWRYRETIMLPDGNKKRISGSAPKHCNTKIAAHQAFLDHIARERDPGGAGGKEMMTFSTWFEGRFWREWVVGRKNKPSEQDSKRRHYHNYLKPYFGDMSIGEIGVAEVAQFRSFLVTAKRGGRNGEHGLSDKYINNILGVLSKALRYAEDVELIRRAPRVGIFKTERPEIECWDFEQYSRLLEAAMVEGPMWFVAVCLAGEAGLRVGEVKGVDWRKDVDLIAGSLTVSRQIQEASKLSPTFVSEDRVSKGRFEGTPKGRTRRVVPISGTLDLALRTLRGRRSGYVVCNADGSPFSVGQVNAAIHRICRRADLPARGWHLLRHTFGTHAAMFGVNPWTLMNWMGHKRIDETMRYVNLASHHWRPLPHEISLARDLETDPVRRIIAMLAARYQGASAGQFGKGAAKTQTEKKKAR